MILSDHFVYLYNEIFKELEKFGPGAFSAFFPPYGGHLPNRCLASPAEGYRKAVVKVLMQGEE